MSENQDAQDKQFHEKLTASRDRRAIEENLDSWSVWSLNQGELYGTQFGQIEDIHIGLVTAGAVTDS